MLIKTIRYSLYSLAAVLILAGCLVGSLNRTDLEKLSFYQESLSALDTLNLLTGKSGAPLYASWQKLYLVPDYSMPMAGYKPRNGYDQIQDSLYFHILYLSNGLNDAFFISADLLLFPNYVKKEILDFIQYHGAMNNTFCYFGASHTHSSLGGWDSRPAWSLYVGRFDQQWWEYMTEEITRTMVNLKSQKKPSEWSYFEKDAGEYTSNRLAGKDGLSEGMLRGIFVRNTLDTLQQICLYAYSAHPTTESSKSRVLSGDYPAAIAKHLKKETSTEAIFMAGMVGSHSLANVSADNGLTRAERAGELLGEKILSVYPQEWNSGMQITSATVPLKYGKAQLRLSKNLILRPWLYNKLFGALQGEMRLLLLDEVLFIGVAAEFSGEIYQRENLGKLAENLGVKLLITGFNGDYTGYVVWDEHYDKYDKEEVRTTGWMGPYAGTFYTQLIQKTLSKIEIAK
ncbi:MAG: hypothetical protein JJU28_09895 [Cyclobacteriaceae bacterium]|nr:hypothetical protein [Cyclobacteriaceae bacterium]